MQVQALSISHPVGMCVCGIHKNEKENEKEYRKIKDKTSM